MADMFDYLLWRGDITFSQVPLNPVDNLLFSTLVYVDFSGIVPEDAVRSVPLHIAAAALLELPDREDRVRIKTDLRLLEAMASAPRFRDTRLTFYRSRLIEEEETQFAAMTYLLEDGTAFVCYRGTDESLVGWKEDFNMSFLSSVPAQREALAYLEEFAQSNLYLLRLGGHSKGGNLAIYAGAMCHSKLRLRILTVYNNDGPGFPPEVLEQEGYRQLLPKIHTFIPESSIIGVLLEQQGAYKVIKSKLVSVLQHEVYSWEVQAGDFIYVPELSDTVKHFDKTVKQWLAEMTQQERGDFVDALYQLIRAGGANQVQDLLNPKSILATFRTLHTNEQARKLLTGEFVELLRIAFRRPEERMEKDNENNNLPSTV